MDRNSKNVSSAAHSLGSPAPVGICRPTVLSFVFNEALCFLKGGELLEGLVPGWTEEGLPGWRVSVLQR